MKNLFKNSFFSFLQSKVGMILLSIIVFLTAAVFTVLSSASFSFKKSYNDVMETGRLHDFTAKEKYNLDGELKFNESAPTSQDVLAEDMTTGAFSQDAQYVYFELKDIPNALTLTMTPDFNTTEILGRLGIANRPGGRTNNDRNALIRIPYNTLSFIDKDGDDVIDDVALLKNSINFEVASKIYTDSSTKHTYELPITNTLTSGSLLAHAKDSDTIWKSNDKFRIDTATNAGQLLDSTKTIVSSNSTAKLVFTKNDFNAKQQLEDFKHSLVHAVATKNYFHKTTHQAITVSLDKVNSTGIYQLLLNAPTGTDKVRLEEFQSTQKKIEDYIKVIGLDRPFVLSSSGGKEQIKAAEGKISEFLKQFAFEERRSNFISKIDEKYRNVLDHKFTQSVTISDDEKNFKLVDSIDNEQKINTLHKFSGYNLPSPASDAEMLDELKKAWLRQMLKDYPTLAGKITEADFDTTQVELPLSPTLALAVTMHSTIPVVNKEKGFAYIAHWNNATVEKTAAQGGSPIFLAIAQAAAAKQGGLSHEMPNAVRVTDPSGFFAAVSPGYYNAHDIKLIDPQKILGDQVLREKLNSDPNAVFDQFKESVIQVGLVKYFAVASAIQPDFAFPIIDAKNPIPNSQTQAVVFTNNSGYQRGLDAYRNNEKEEYISFKFKDGVNANKDAIIADIESISREAMSWPSNIQIISKADDTSEKVILAPQRVAFLQKLEKSISTIAILTSVMLMIFVVFVVTLVVKKQINSKRKMLGILLANGYTKTQISLSMATISLIIVVVPAILGYVVGISIQQGLFGIFRDYWTLPLSARSFSWETLLLTVGLPTVGVALLASFVTRWELRGRLVDILNNSESKTAGFLGVKVLRAFKWMGIKSRISISIFTSNISKMFLILFSSALAITTAAVAASMLGKFDYAKTQSTAPLQYNFAINLESPTAESGLLRTSTPDQMGGDWNDDLGKIMQNIMQDPKDSYNDHPVWHLPSSSDEAQSKEAGYLDNRIQVQALLNGKLGSSGLTSVPWDVTKKLMPEGQTIVSQKQNNIFLYHGVSLAYNQKFASQPWFKQIQEAKANNKDVGVLDGIATTTLSNEFKEFFAATYKDIVTDYVNKKQFMPYVLSYRTIMMDSSDETYTFLQGQYTGSNIVGKTEMKKVDVIGVKPHSHMIEIPDNLMDKVSSYKGNNIPVIVNEYFKEMYKKDVGSTFTLDVTNMPTRYIDGKNAIHDKVFEVVGIQDTYNDVKVYTTQEVANKALGYDTMLRPNESQTDMFNGVFSKEESPTIFANLALYSVSGFYPGTDTIVQGDVTEQLLDKALATAPFKGVAASNPNVKKVTEYVQTYSRSPYVMAWSNVDWAKMSNYAFDSTLDLSSKIIWLIEIVAIIISILFTAIITTMLIADNKKFISTLKVMGYRRREILSTFFKSLIPSILIGALISIPVVFGLIVMIKVAIIGFGSVLIPLHLIGWEIIAATAITLFLSVLIYWLSTKELKDADMLAAFKE